MNHELKDLILETVEQSLDAQLRAVRRLRKGGPPTPPKPRSRLSQVDLAYNILKKARSPLHISDLLQRIEAAYSVSIDRESLVSSLSKKIARRDRFQRTAKNTFALLEEQK